MIKKIQNIARLYIRSNFVAYQYKNLQTFVNGDFFSSNIYELPYIVGGKYLIYYDLNDNYTYSIDRVTNQTKRVGNIYFCLNLFGYDSVDIHLVMETTLNDGVYSSRYLEINLMNGEVIQEFDFVKGWSIIAQKGTFLIIASRDTIKAQDKNSLKWEYSLKEVGKWYNPYAKPNKWQSGERSKLLGIYKGILWVTLGNDVVLGINAETGETVHKFSSPISSRTALTNISEEENLPLTRYAQLDVSQEIILAIDNFKLIEIDISEEHPVKKVYDIEESMREFGFTSEIRTSSWVFDEKYIYFYDNGVVSRTLRVGIFDRRTRKVIAETIIETESTGINLVGNFGVCQDEIYVLDGNATLWVISIPELVGGIKKK